jgi:hypothetical protein
MKQGKVIGSGIRGRSALAARAAAVVICAKMTSVDSRMLRGEFL